MLKSMFRFWWLIEVAGIIASLISPASGGNFTVTSPDVNFSRRVLAQAETYRREQSIAWFGDEMPTWYEPCPINIRFANATSGSTTFTFGDGGNVFDWRMNVFGQPTDILESVLPHEVLHTVFASHFREWLPRWADEGACSTIEGTKELKRIRSVLNVALQTRRGIAFNQMVGLMDYPADIGAMYAQGESVVDFLLQHDGKRHFTKFLSAGLKSKDWSGELCRSYGYKRLVDVQVAWLDWYKAGSPRNADMAGTRHSVGYG